MKRGELYLVPAPRPDPRRQRVVLIVSRQDLVDAESSTVVCAPVYSVLHGLATQVIVGEDIGLKSLSSVHCDRLLSVEKTALTNYIGSLPAPQLADVNRALAIALALDPGDMADATDDPDP